MYSSLPMYKFRRHFEMNLVAEDDIQSLVWAGKTHAEIASLLQPHFRTLKRGLIERNVREYCHVRGIHKSKFRELDNIVLQMCF